MFRLAAKCDALLLNATIQELIHDLQTRISLFNAAAAELLSSRQFEAVLHVVLSLGNALNDGSLRVAQGFTMDSLLLLVNTVAADGTTLLTYLVSTIKNKTPHLLDVCQTLPSVQKASAQSNLPVLQQSVAALKCEVAAATKEAEDSTKDNSEFGEFSNRMELAMSKADQQVEQLQESIVKMDEQLLAMLMYYGDRSNNTAQAKPLLDNIARFCHLFQTEVKSQDKRAKHTATHPQHGASIATPFAQAAAMNKDASKKSVEKVIAQSVSHTHTAFLDLV